MTIEEGQKPNNRGVWVGATGRLGRVHESADREYRREKSRPQAGVTLGTIAAVACLTALLRLGCDSFGLWLAVYSHVPALRFLVLVAIGLLVPLGRVLLDRSNWSTSRIITIVIIGAAIGFLVGTVVAERRESRLLAPGEHQYMAHLFHVSRVHMDSDEFGGGLAGTFIPVFNEERIKVAARKLRMALFEADHDFMRHLIAIGGPETPHVERALQKGVRWLPKFRQLNASVIVVTPSPISGKVRQTLEAKGLRITEVIDEPSDL